MDTTDPHFSDSLNPWKAGDEDTPIDAIDPETTDPQIRYLLNAWKAGDEDALNHLVPWIYSDLKRIAHRFIAKERINHTLQTTALVDEIYIKLAGRRLPTSAQRRELLQYVTRMMRNLLVDHARSRLTQKRGSQFVKVSFQEVFDRPQPLSWPPEQALAFDQALKRLVKLDPVQAQIVDLWLLGWTVREIAKEVEYSKSKAQRELRTAQIFLYREIFGSTRGEDQ